MPNKKQLPEKMSKAQKTYCLNGFALNYDKSLQIYFFSVKRPAQNDFLKDVKSTVVTHR